jgi:hypothetical protein
VQIHLEGVDPAGHDEYRGIGGGFMLTEDVHRNLDDLPLMYPMTAAIADACRDLTVTGRPVTVDLIGLPWLAHPRALLERTIDVGFTLTVAGRLPAVRTMRSQPLWDEPNTFALISNHHPLANADQIDPRDLADLPLQLPDAADNPDIYNLILEQLADAGVPAPRRAPPLGTFANVIAHIAAGNGWSFSARTLAQQTPPGIAARPLAVTPRHNVRFERDWQVWSADGSARGSA